jgi:hypothetical protein
MTIHLSTATVFAHENRNRAMNLHYHPIVMFEGNDPYISSHLENIVWTIHADPIGKNVFRDNGRFSPFDPENGLSFLEFDLSKSDVAFQHDDYPCKITFSATVDSPLSSPMDIKHEVYGIVRIKWSKGLQ